MGSGVEPENPPGRGDAVGRRGRPVAGPATDVAALVEVRPHELARRLRSDGEEDCVTLDITAVGERDATRCERDCRRAGAQFDAVLPIAVGEDVTDLQAKRGGEGSRSCFEDGHVDAETSCCGGDLCTDEPASDNGEPPTGA